MIAKSIVIILVVAMLVSLFSAMVYMIRDRGTGTRTVKALTWRIGIWVVLFAFLWIAVKAGWIEPSISIRPDEAPADGNEGTPAPAGGQESAQ
jgi:hypothetical protein